MTVTAQAPTLRRAVLLMTASSFLVPAAGLVTAPILARALSTDGRGELAAALAPAALMLAAATLGLPDALTYILAKRPRMTRPALFWASLITVGLGLVCLLAVFWALPFLSGGDPGLGRLILLATALTVPALVVNVFRGAATGHQMWRAVAVERLITTALKVVVFALLFVAGDLTVFLAVLVTCLTVLLAGVVYLPLLRRPDPQPNREQLDGEQADGDQRDGDQRDGDQRDGEQAADPAGADEGIVRSMVSFGSKVWLGSVAAMMLARASQLLMTPLSSVQDLGLYSVATTVSDVPLIVALAVQGALFGVNSQARDPAQVTATSRLTLLVALAGCLVLGGTLPLWIGPLFGSEFRPALVPTLMLLFAALLCIPGLMAATGLTAWGRPGLRSLGLSLTLLVNVGVFVLLVPSYGVYGAAWTSIASNVVLTSFMILAARRVMGVRGRDFWLVGPADVGRAWAEGVQILRRLTPRRTG